MRLEKYFTTEVPAPKVAPGWGATWTVKWLLYVQGNVRVNQVLYVQENVRVKRQLVLYGRRKRNGPH